MTDEKTQSGPDDLPRDTPEDDTEGHGLVRNSGDGAPAPDDLGARETTGAEPDEWRIRE